MQENSNSERPKTPPLDSSLRKQDLFDTNHPNNIFTGDNFRKWQRKVIINKANKDLINYADKYLLEY